MMITELEAIIEAILFVSGEPVPLHALADATGQDEKTAKRLALSLADKYDAEKRGVTIVEVDGAVQMCSNPIYYEYVQKAAQCGSKKPLSQASLETLAIIAYKQPVTKGQIEEIRGVDAGHIVNKLLEYGLITERGRADIPGKPLMFGTTEPFLQYFGLTDLGQLPPLDDDYDQLKREVEEEILQF